jgi:hypothetical protein
VEIRETEGRTRICDLWPSLQSQGQSRINQCLQVVLLCARVPREAGITCDTRASKFVCHFHHCTTEPNFPIYIHQNQVFSPRVSAYVNVRLDLCALCLCVQICTQDVSKVTPKFSRSPSCTHIKVKRCKIV